MIPRPRACATVAGPHAAREGRSRDAQPDAPRLGRQPTTHPRDARPRSSGRCEHPVFARAVRQRLRLRRRLPITRRSRHGVVRARRARPRDARHDRVPGPAARTSEGHLNVCAWSPTQAARLRGQALAAANGIHYGRAGSSLGQRERARRRLCMARTFRWATSCSTAAGCARLRILRMRLMAERRGRSSPSRARI